MTARDVARELIQALAEDIAVVEELADLCFDLSRQIEHCGEVDTATMLAQHVRLHRVASIQLKARLGALMKQGSIQDLP